MTFITISTVILPPVVLAGLGGTLFYLIFCDDWGE